MTVSVPAVRVRALNAGRVRKDGRYVLYWMVAARRTRFNFGLQYAVERARELGCGVVVLEALRVDYPWASDRLHGFVLDGMRDNAAALAGSPVAYYPYVEPRAGAGAGLLAALAESAALVVTDDYPVFFVPRMIAAAARRVAVRCEAVDGNGLYPMHATERVFTTAASFRRHLHKELPAHLGGLPRRDSIGRGALRPARIVPAVSKRWPAATLEAVDVSALPIDHAVTRTGVRGGAVAGRRALRRFVAERLERYADHRNDLVVQAQSELSPYLHFGHVAAHEVFAALVKAADWSPARLADTPTGSREGWWGIEPNTEAFLDQLITWREIGFNMASHRQDYASYDSLPGWAQTTLAKHARDPREHVYSLAQLEAAATADPLWNAAQTQLVREGTIHNYLRMLWGKKILEWTASPRDALAAMIELNDKYALDGRDPNSYSGILWVLGRYDRAWGERPIFGKVRFMSSASTARKMRTAAYIDRYAP